MMGPYVTKLKEQAQRKQQDAAINKMMKQRSEAGILEPTLAEVDAHLDKGVSFDVIIPESRRQVGPYQWTMTEEERLQALADPRARGLIFPDPEGETENFFAKTREQGKRALEEIWEDVDLEDDEEDRDDRRDFLKRAFKLMRFSDDPEIDVNDYEGVDQRVAMRMYLGTV
jgi:hypothetical protein